MISTPSSSLTPLSYFSNPLNLRFAGTPVKVWAYDFLTNTGFQIQAHEPVVPGTRAEFEFELGETLLLTVQAVCLYCRTRTTPAGVRFVIDWEFDGDSALDDVISYAAEAGRLELTSH